MQDLSNMRPGDFGFAHLFWTTGEAVIVANLDTDRILLWNPAAEVLFGYSADEALELPYAALVPERLRMLHHVAGQRAEALSWHGVAVGTPSPAEVPAVGKGGEEVAVDLAVSMLDEAPTAGRFIMVRAHDASERVLARERLEQQSEALAAQARLLDLAHDAIMVLDFRDGTIIFWNRGAEARYGWSKDQALGRSAHELLRTVFPEPLEVVKEWLIRDGRWDGELTHHTRDAARLVVASRWSLEVDQQGEPLAILEINSDITHQVRLRQRQDALLRAARRFAGEDDPELALTAVLDEAVAVMEADGAVVLRWDEERDGLVAVRNTVPAAGEFEFVPPGMGAVGQAVQRRAAVILNDYQHASGVPRWALRAETQACVGAPLLHQGRLLGGIAVLSYQPGARFDTEDAEALEVLASLAAVTLARLQPA